MGEAFSLVASRDKLTLPDHLTLEKNYNESKKRAMEMVIKRFGPSELYKMPEPESLEAYQNSNKWWVLQLNDFDVVLQAETALYSISAASDVLVYFTEEHTMASYVACFHKSQMLWQIDDSTSKPLKIVGTPPVEFEKILELKHERDPHGMSASLFAQLTGSRMR